MCSIRLCYVANRKNCFVEYVGEAKVACSIVWVSDRTFRRACKKEKQISSETGRRVKLPYILSFGGVSVRELVGKTTMCFVETASMHQAAG